MLKLSEIVLNEAFGTKIDYSAPRFAIVLNKETGETPGDLILIYDTEVLDQYLNSSPQNANDDNYNSEEERLVDQTTISFDDMSINPVVGYVISNDIEDGCYYARSINYIARNPIYKGSGYLLYAFTSKIFDSPITSDRNHSSSKADKAAWNKIAQDSNFTQTDQFDTYFYDDGLKIYLDVDEKSGYFTTRSGPRTSITSDDCSLAPYEKDFDRAVQKTGSFRAFRYNGSLDASAMIERHKKFISQQKISKEAIMQILSAGADAIWNKVYKYD